MRAICLSSSGLTLAAAAGSRIEIRNACSGVKVRHPAPHHTPPAHPSPTSTTATRGKPCLPASPPPSEVRLAAGGVLHSSPHFEGAREFLTVSKGRVEVESGTDSQTLARGDSANYPADVPHLIANAGRSEALVFLVVIYQ